MLSDAIGLKDPNAPGQVVIVDPTSLPSLGMAHAKQKCDPALATA